MTESQQPVELIPQPESKQKCQVCNALLARMFIDLNGRRLYLCQQDAYTMLRMACLNEKEAMDRTHKFVLEQVYGVES